MKKLLSIGLLGLLFASCGKQVDIRDLHDRIDDTNDKVSEIEKRLNSLYDALSGLNAQIDDVNINQDNLTQIVNTTVSSVAILETSMTVKEVIDPCGDNVGQFDEVLLVMSDGSIIGYFESGGKRFLTSLPDGNYRTTDVQACNFSIVNGIYQE